MNVPDSPTTPKAIASSDPPPATCLAESCNSAPTDASMPRNDILTVQISVRAYARQEYTPKSSPNINHHYFDIPSQAVKIANSQCLSVLRMIVALPPLVATPPDGLSSQWARSSPKMGSNTQVCFPCTLRWILKPQAVVRTYGYESRGTLKKNKKKKSGSRVEVVGDGPGRWTGTTFEMELE